MSLSLYEVAQQVERARHENGLPELVPASPRGDGVGHDLDVLEVTTREGGDVVGRKRPGRRAPSRNETRARTP